jgi:hypothetical protein
MQEMDMLSIETQFRSETPAKIKCVLFLPGLLFFLYLTKTPARGRLAVWQNRKQKTSRAGNAEPGAERL